jgi:hypothetical protein
MKYIHIFFKNFLRLLLVGLHGFAWTAWFTPDMLPNNIALFGYDTLISGFSTKIIENTTQTSCLIFIYLGSRSAENRPYIMKSDSFERLLEPTYLVSGGVFLACSRQPVSLALLSPMPPSLRRTSPLHCRLPSPPLSLVRLHVVESTRERLKWIEEVSTRLWVRGIGRW